MTEKDEEGGSRDGYVYRYETDCREPETLSASFLLVFVLCIPLVWRTRFFFSLSSHLSSVCRIPKPVNDKRSVKMFASFFFFIFSSFFFLLLWHHSEPNSLRNGMRSRPYHASWLDDAVCKSSALFLLELGLWKGGKEEGRKEGRRRENRLKSVLAKIACDQSDPSEEVNRKDNDDKRGNKKKREEEKGKIGRKKNKQSTHTHIHHVCGRKEEK